MPLFHSVCTVNIYHNVHCSVHTLHTAHYSVHSAVSFIVDDCTVHCGGGGCDSVAGTGPHPGVRGHLGAGNQSQDRGG